MKKVFYFILIITLSKRLSAQDITLYKNIISKAETAYYDEKYLESANLFSEAFKSIGWQGTLEDRYNAARAWTLAEVPDSAFFQLNRVIDKLNFSDINKITTEPAFKKLYRYNTWNGLVAQVYENKRKEEEYKLLIAQLDTIFQRDQQSRIKLLDTLMVQYSKDSKEVKSFIEEMKKTDSINVKLVTNILDKYGWLGKDAIKERGNLTLFLIIQHANTDTQIKYLPMMRDAVKNGNARPQDLALLEDRVGINTKGKQIYGSQVQKDSITNQYFLLPLEDPANVDKRRKEVGLPPLASYLKQFNIVWEGEK